MGMWYDRGTVLKNTGEDTNMQTTRPFHETIVTMIRRSSRDVELECLARLIKITKIPEGHDEIIMAWRERIKAMCWCGEDLGIPANLLEQKRASTKKTNGEKKCINLDELQQETEKLLALLKDKQPGLMTWNEFVHERLQNLHKLTSRALGK
jgi:hypothetical protein